MTANNGFDKHARWAELAVTIGASVIASAVTVSWTMASSLTRIEQQILQHQSRLDVQGGALIDMQGRVNGQGTQIAVVGSQFGDILRRLDTIDRKLDRN